MFNAYKYVVKTRKRGILKDVFHFTLLEATDRELIAKAKSVFNEYKNEKFKIKA